MALIVSVMFVAGLLDQDAAAGSLMTGSSPIGAMISSVMYLAGWTAHLMAWTTSSTSPQCRLMLAVNQELAMSVTPIGLDLAKSIF